MTSQDLKAKIGTIVEDYQRLFPEEFKAFSKWSAEERSKQVDEYARVTKDSSAAIERKLGELPENLHNMFTKRLTQEEQDWFRAQGRFMKDFRGPYWFYKKYPVFSVTTI